jgi:hypothetical protein
MALTDDEEQMANQIAMDASVQLMLRYLFELHFAVTNDPQKFRDEVKTQLLELSDTTDLPSLKQEVIARAREQMKLLISQLLDNTPLRTKRN